MASRPLLWSATAALLAPLLGVLLLGATFAGGAPESKHASSHSQTAGGTAPVHRIVVSEAISSATVTFVKDALTGAQNAKAQALLIELDTPGGTLDATRELVQMILASRVPVIVYVSPPGARAASAGTLLTLSAHIAAMAPGTHIGAAHPVTLFGKPDETMREKIVNDTAAFAESIAQLRGRNAAWAVSAVRESRSITETAAFKLKVVDLIAEDDADLLRQIDGRTVSLSKTEQVTLHTQGAALVTQQQSLTQGLLGWLSNPDVMFLFLVAGLIGLYVEFSHPGLIFPGVAGGVCLLIALVGLHTLPVHYGAVALILLGAGMLAAEAYVTSFGALAVAGLASLVLGSLFLFDEGKSDLAVNPVLIAATAGVLAVLALVIGRLLVRSVRLPRQSMQATLVGQRAEVAIAIRPDAPGRVRLRGEHWKARAERELPVGTPVVVTRVEGLVVDVEAAPPQSSTSGPA